MMNNMCGIDHDYIALSGLGSKPNLTQGVALGCMNTPFQGFWNGFSTLVE
jgi:hypothetical protein